MTYNEYLNACLDFAEKSQDWLGIDRTQFYTTSVDEGGWRESCDNAHGGIAVDWAFNLSAEKVRELCPGEYAREILGLMRSMVDDECDYDTMYDALAEFND